MDGISVEVTFSEGLYRAYALVRRDGGTTLCLPRSQVARDYYRARYGDGERADRYHAQFVEHVGRVQAVLDANQRYLLGEAGVAAFVETQIDREEARRARRHGSS